jgi:hypothetical protein
VTRQGVPIQVVAAVVRDHDLLPEPVVAVGATAFAFSAPHADQRQQCQQGVVQIGTFAQIRGIGWDGQVVEDRNVARRGHLGAFERCGHRTVSRTG